MGLIENLGAVASSYMDEKEKLESADEKRKRTRAGHGFWPGWQRGHLEKTIPTWTIDSLADQN